MKWIKRIILSILIGLIILVAINFTRINRLVTVMGLFEPENISQNFLTMEDIFPTTEIAASQNPTKFHHKSVNLPEEFSFKDSIINTRNYLESTKTAGLIVLQGDTILHELYGEGLSPDEDYISWSVCKSIVSAMIGIAVQEGFIKSLEEPVDLYAPILKGSGYEGVSIKDVLQMSSGIRFNEDYADKQSDINRMGRVFALGLSFDEYVSSLKSERPAGEYHKYVSMDTQVLGMVLKAATNQTVSKFCEERLWTKMGAENNAYWLTDNSGMEAVFGGFNASLRDYARFGKLFADQGFANNKQIIDSSWVYNSTHATEKHLLPGENEFSNSILGYGYQWWIPEGDDEIFTANGVYNQYIYIDPINKIVIVKCSANYMYGKERKKTIAQHFAFLNAIRKNIIE